MTTIPAMSKGGEAINAATDVVPKGNNRQSVGGQIFSIVIFSILAGSRLEAAFLHHLVPREPYEWIGDLIVGLGMLIGVIALALRLRREVNVKADRRVDTSSETGSALNH
jgi:hypothetical protein